MGERHVRAVRGAITVERDEVELIAAATRELLSTLTARNSLRPEDVISAIFTVTPDLTSEFPARAARDLGWVDVPLLCAVEIATVNGLPRCIRVLLHVETDLPREATRHVYLGAARALRPDLRDDREGI
ncbi:MAG TPA: chorismate mutase [Gemmatimonadaceae bacterium]|jgi:monofunctional chorismate mutase, gram positive type, clade 1